MMKHIAAIAALGLLFAAPATAQSASDIAKAKSGKSCVGCNLFQADFSYDGIRNVNLSKSRLRQSDMTAATMDGVNFSGANLSIANLAAGRFTGASFKGADLSQATLVGGSFDGANFAGANLTGANLSGAEMAKAYGLTQKQLNKACGDHTTQLRGNLTIPRCK